MKVAVSHFSFFFFEHECVYFLLKQQQTKSREYKLNGTAGNVAPRSGTTHDTCSGHIRSSLLAASHVDAAACKKQKINHTSTGSCSTDLPLRQDRGRKESSSPETGGGGVTTGVQADFLLKYVHRIPPDVTNLEEEKKKTQVGGDQIESGNQQRKMRMVAFRGLLVYFHCCPKES